MRSTGISVKPRRIEVVIREANVPGIVELLQGPGNFGPPDGTPIRVSICRKDGECQPMETGVEFLQKRRGGQDGHWPHIFLGRPGATDILVQETISEIFYVLFLLKIPVAPFIKASFDQT